MVGEAVIMRGVVELRRMVERRAAPVVTRGRASEDVRCRFVELPRSGIAGKGRRRARVSRPQPAHRLRDRILSPGGYVATHMTSAPIRS
jgi:hypothetical protein